MIFLNRKSKTPLKHQLYDEIKRLILSGQWKPGYKLPSSRMLAEELGISRPIISLAFEQLVNEGYINPYVGSGTFVMTTLASFLYIA